MKETLSNIAVVRACWSAIICKYKYPLCVSCLCFLSVFSLYVFFLCFLSVLSVCVICLRFLSVFLIRLRLLPHYQKRYLSKYKLCIILLWSGLADQLLFADINSQLIWLQYKYKILTRYFGLSGSPASSFVHHHHHQTGNRLQIIDHANSFKLYRSCNIGTVFDTSKGSYSSPDPMEGTDVQSSC